MTGVKLTLREQQVWGKLTDQPQSPGAIARAAGIRTTSPSETVARYCIQLTGKGLAERCGTVKAPKWKLKELSQ